MFNILLAALSTVLVANATVASGRDGRTVRAARHAQPLRHFCTQPALTLRREALSAQLDAKLDKVNHLELPRAANDKPHTASTHPSKSQAGVHASLPRTHPSISTPAAPAGPGGTKKSRPSASALQPQTPMAAATRGAHGSAGNASKRHALLGALAAAEAEDTVEVIAEPTQSPAHVRVPVEATVEYSFNPTQLTSVANTFISSIRDSLVGQLGPLLKFDETLTIGQC